MSAAVLTPVDSSYLGALPMNIMRLGRILQTSQPFGQSIRFRMATPDRQQFRAYIHKIRAHLLQSHYPGSIPGDFTEEMHLVGHHFALAKVRLIGASSRCTDKNSSSLNGNEACNHTPSLEYSKGNVNRDDPLICRGETGQILIRVDSYTSRRIEHYY